MGNSESNIEGGVNLDELYKDIMGTENYKIFLYSDKLEELLNKICLYDCNVLDKQDERYKMIEKKYKEYLVMSYIRPKPIFPQLQNTCFYDATMHLLSSIRDIEYTCERILKDEQSKTVAKYIAESVCRSYASSKFNENSYRTIYKTYGLEYGSSDDPNNVLDHFFKVLNINTKNRRLYCHENDYTINIGVNKKDTEKFLKYLKPDDNAEPVIDNILMYIEVEPHGFEFNCLDIRAYFMQDILDKVYELKPLYFILYYSRDIMFVDLNEYHNYTIAGIICQKRSIVEAKKRDGAFIVELYSGITKNIYYDEKDGLYTNATLYDDDKIIDIKYENGYLYPKLPKDKGRYRNSMKRAVSRVHDAGNFSLIYLEKLDCYLIPSTKTYIYIDNEKLYYTGGSTNTHYVCYFPVHRLRFDSFNADKGIVYDVKDFKIVSDNRFNIPVVALYVRTEE